MRFLPLLFLFLLAVSSTDLFAYERGVWQKNEAAIALIEQQQFDQALQILLEALIEMPDNDALSRNIAACYLGVAHQQLGAGQNEDAAQLARAGKEYNDQDARLWLVRGTALLRNGLHLEAESELNEAWAMSGDEPQVLQQLGQLYYETDRMFEAIDIWQKALNINPENALLAERLEKVQRELAVEKELERYYSGHFILSFDENGKADIGGQILDALEEAYTWAAAKLGYYPERQTPVILYTQRQFSGLTGSPEWVAGLYDGKIRLPIGGLGQVGGSVKALLAHEFMHVMVRDMAGNKVPYWLNEGLAEIAARELDDPALVHLGAAADQGHLFPLDELNVAFRGIATNRIALAYEQSYSFVRYLIDRFGWFQMAELLRQYKNGATNVEAFERVYGDYAADFSSLERDWRRQL